MCVKTPWMCGAGSDAEVTSPEERPQLVACRGKHLIGALFTVDDDKNVGNDRAGGAKRDSRLNRPGCQWSRRLHTRRTRSPANNSPFDDVPGRVALLFLLDYHERQTHLQ